MKKDIKIKLKPFSFQSKTGDNWDKWHVIYAINKTEALNLYVKKRHPYLGVHHLTPSSILDNNYRLSGTDSMDLFYIYCDIRCFEGICQEKSLLLIIKDWFYNLSLLFTYRGRALCQIKICQIINSLNLKK